MFCIKCGTDDDRSVLKERMMPDGDIIVIEYYGKCTECGSLIGRREIFRLKDWDNFIEEEIVKKVLEEG